MIYLIRSNGQLREAAGRLADLVLEPFDGSTDFYSIWRGRKKGVIPSMLLAYGPIEELKDKVHQPFCKDLPSSVYSDEMLAICKSLGECDFRINKFTVIDDTFYPELYGKLKAVPEGAKTLDCYNIVDVLTECACFDFDKSDYSREQTAKRNDGYADFVVKTVLKVPEGGFPPIFRVAERWTRDVYIREDVKQAFDAAGIEDIRYIPVEVSL